MLCSFLFTGMGFFAGFTAQTAARKTKRKICLCTSAEQFPPNISRGSPADSFARYTFRTIDLDERTETPVPVVDDLARNFRLSSLWTAGTRLITAHGQGRIFWANLALRKFESLRLRRFCLRKKPLECLEGGRARQTSLPSDADSPSTYAVISVSLVHGDILARAPAKYPSHLFDR